MISSNPNYLPKPPTPNTIALGVGRFQHMDFGVTDIQSITPVYLGVDKIVEVSESSVSGN